MIHYHTSERRVVTLRIDAGAVNPLSHLFQRELEAQLVKLEAQGGQLAGVVVRFDKPAPAGEHEFDHLLALTPDQAGACMRTLGAYQGLLRRLELLGAPVVAALSGAVEGHALGLALACPRRLALADVVLRMPQVSQGLVPSGGALARAVRASGLQAALPLLMDGLPLDAAQALQAGLLHAIAADEDALAQLAQGAIETRPAPRQPWDQAQYRMPGGAPSAPQLQTLLQVAPAMLRQKTGGHYPAPEAILCAMVEGAQVDFASALLIESRYFCQVATGAVAKNLMRLKRQQRLLPAPQAGPFCAALLAAYHAEARLLAAEGLAPALIANAAGAAGMRLAPALAATPDAGGHGTEGAAAPVTAAAPAALADAGTRLLQIQCMAALAALESGAVASAAQADLASIALCGFPSFCGGVIGLIGHLGEAAFETRANALAAAHGTRFKLPSAWRALARTGESL
ncbi:MAG TPA: fatty acid oxidation complex subunit alpha [Janthinobacterium sp.]|nr:fatty acid oxidation complex subunit alpha [Janthinobacterium sp.]